MRLKGQLIPQASLDCGERDQMLALMQRHYAGVQPEVFLADLAEKDWVITVRDVASVIRGFSTQMLFQATVGHRRVRALFSGDTVVDKDYWGDFALSHVWGRLALDLIEQYPREELYWFLISQGFRTYRFLPLFFHEFFPRCDRPMTHATRQVIDALALSKFPHSYDPTRGVVRAAAQQYHLRESLAEIPASRLRDPHVRFFVQANPGFSVGDELCCAAMLTRDNFTTAAWRVIGPVDEVAEPTLCESPLG